MVEFEEEFADACEFFAEDEFAASLFTSAPLLLALTDAPVAAEIPA
jgi:hypothetical protein